MYLKDLNERATVKRDASFLRLVGASRIIGLPTSRLNYSQRMLPDGTFEHEAVLLTRGLHDLGQVNIRDTACWDIRLTDEERASALAAIAATGNRPFFAVSVGTKMHAKNWGGQNWRALLQQLAKLYSTHALVLAGAPEEHAASEAAAEGWRSMADAGPAINLCGRLTPRQSAAVFTHARAFLGHDSGPMHLASIVNTPTLALFAARNKPKTWYPMCAHQRVIYHKVDCWGCGLETCIEQRKKCILSITVPEVMHALKDMLAEVERALAVQETGVYVS